MNLFRSEGVVRRIRRAVGAIARQTIPPFLLDTASRIAGREAYRTLSYQGVKTIHNTRRLHVGRFAELYEKYQPLNPNVPLNRMRYSLYNICMFAHLCRKVPGDFLFAGISHGVAPRLAYDFVEFGLLDKTLHLIDPFTAVQEGTTEPHPFYNTDSRYVETQYPRDAPIKIHDKKIPDALPLRNVSKVAFVCLNTGNVAAEIASLPILFDQLSHNGAIFVEQYGIGDGFFDQYDPVFAKLQVEPLWLPSGQCVVFKR